MIAIIDDYDISSPVDECSVCGLLLWRIDILVLHGLLLWVPRFASFHKCHGQRRPKSIRRRRHAGIRFQHQRRRQPGSGVLEELVQFIFIDATTLQFQCPLLVTALLLC